MAFDYTIEKYSENEVLTPVKLNNMVNGLQQLKDCFNQRILESDGVTAKKATSSANASNVTNNINGKAISEIFESNGTTIKKATTADKVVNGLTVNVNGESVVYNGSSAKIVQIVSKNPNLLINPDFKINQRGKSSYSSYEYTVDRWKLNSSSSTCRIDGNKVIFKSTAAQKSICLQYIEDYQRLCGKTLTLSVKWKVKPTVSWYVYIYYGLSTNYASTSGSEIEKKVTFTVPTNATCLMISCTMVSAGEFIPEYWKLEEGNIATPFIAPDPTLEMMKCYRYYLKLAENAPYCGWIFGGDQARINFITPVQMRVTPTLSIEGGLISAGVYTSGKTYDITSCNFHQYRGCALVAQMFLASTAPASHAAAFRTVKYAYLDAEI